LIYIEGRANSLVHFNYRRVGDSWVPLRMRTTLFNEGGQPSAILDQDLSQATYAEKRVTSMQREQGLRSTFKMAGQRILAFARPDALYAATATMDYDSACAAELLNLQSCIITAAAASAAFTAALLACPGSGGLLCLAAVPYSIAASAAALALSSAWIAYRNCKAQHPCFDSNLNVPEGPLGALHPSMTCLQEPEFDDSFGDFAATNGGGADPGCEWMTMQISYDGGETWQNYGEPFQVCEDDET
jgi:hypothetical protein